MPRSLRSILTYEPYYQPPCSSNPIFSEGIMLHPLSDFLLCVFLVLEDVVCNLNGENEMVRDCEQSLVELPVKDRTIENFIEIAKKKSNDEIVGLLKLFLPGNKYSFLVSEEKFDTLNADQKKALGYYHEFFGIFEKCDRKKK